MPAGRARAGGLAAGVVRALPSLARLASAALAGAAGLGLEVVLVGAAGLSVGFARAAALGLGAYVSGWGLGALAAGRARVPARWLLLAAGGLSGLAAALLPAALIERGQQPGAPAPAAALALGALFLAGLPQGLFLPALARLSARAGRGVRGIFAANLLGGVAGALWVGSAATAALGRPGAGHLAAALAAVAGLAGWWSARRSGPLERAVAGPGWPAEEPGAEVFAGPSPWVVVGAATVWTIGLEWVLLRLAVLFVGSREAALASVLAASFLALSVGAWTLPALLPRDGRGVAWALLAAVVLGAWPLVAPPWLAALLADGHGELVVALALVGPPLLPLGALIPLLHRATDPAATDPGATEPGTREPGASGPEATGPESAEAGATPRPAAAVPGAGGRPGSVPDGGRPAGRRLGRLLVHEAWAALLAGPLAHWVLVPFLGLGGALVALALLAVPAGLALRRAAGAPRSGAVRAAAGVVAALGGGAAALGLFGPEARGRVRALGLSAPVFGDPALTVRSYVEDAEFSVTVVDDGLLGERTLLTDTFRAAGDGRDYRYMRVLGHLPLLLHPAPRRVAVVALGTGTTVGAVSLHPETHEVDVLELSSAVVDAAADFAAVNRGALEDPRVRVRLGDGRRTLASRPASYDVVTIEPLLPDSPFGVYLYTPGFYTVARRALAPGGLVCQWVPPHALEPEVFAAVLDAFRRSFRWSGLWTFGSQVVLVGGEERPALDAARFRAPGADLAEALTELGLDSPARIAARFVSSGEAWPACARPLSDGDPWVVFGAKPGGVEALSWLPDNLERLAAGRADDSEWLAPDVGGLRSALGRLLEARVAQGRAELDLARGARSALETRAAVDAALAHVAAPEDPEVRAFVDSVRFLRAIRDGVALLRVGEARGAVEALVTAVELRPERADAHLYLAAALAGAGLEAPAARAREEALARCPRVWSTPAGQRARALGLDP